MSGNKDSVKSFLPLFVILGIWILGSVTPLEAHSCWFPCHHHHYGCFHPGVYTSDGRSIYFFPYGFPRSVHRQFVYPAGGPELRWAGHYRWTCHPSYFGQPAYQVNFQGPYWTYTVYRPSRGLFRRSGWRAAWVPYYLAPIPTTPALAPPAALPGPFPGPFAPPAYPAPPQP